MDLRQLRYFIAVAEERNFSRAAVRLRVSQPPLSVQIRSLEQELGVRLLDRGNRGAALTPAGAAFLVEARAVLAAAERAKVAAKETERGEIGTLSIGFVSMAAYGLLPAALKAFRHRHPRVEVRLEEMTTDVQQRELNDGRIDLGLALAPVVDARLEFHALSRESLLVAAPQGHPVLKGGGSIDVKRLAGEDFVASPRELAPGLHDLIQGTCQDAGFTPRIAQWARQMQTVVSLVAGGMGVALVPESLRHMKRTGVTYRPLKGRHGHLTIGALRRAGDERAATANFLQVVRATRFL